MSDFLYISYLTASAGLLGWIFFFFLLKNRNYTCVIIPVNSASTKLGKDLSISWDNEKEAARHPSRRDIL